MDVSERLQFFYETIKCCYLFYRWEYDAQLQILHTDSLDRTAQGDLPRMLHMSEVLKREGSIKDSKPIIFDSGFGLRWIAAFEYHKDAIYRYHLIGPASTGAISSQALHRQLSAYSLSNEEQFSVLHLIHSVPIVPPMILSQYAMMLHYALTGEQITSMDIRVLTKADEKRPVDMKTDTDVMEGLWAAEQRFCRLILEGNPNYIKVVDQFLSLSGGIQPYRTDDLRSGKNNALVLLTLVSRAAMQGGLSPAITYCLQDDYAGKIENALTIDQVKKLSSQMMKSYVELIQERKSTSGLSIAVQDTCDYISFHLEDDLNVHMLAHRVGYVDYYFTSKFQKETGKPIRDYILEKRMARAADLLIDSDLKVSEIAALLHIQSLSYFNSCFRRWSGKTPGAYRRNR